MQKKYYEEPHFLCLEKLVGISKKTCECLTYPEQSEKLSLIRDSETGLYIDEHEGATNCLFLSKAQCGEEDIWQRLIDARREAILKVITDITVGINGKYQSSADYNRVIGEQSHSGLMNLQAGKVSIPLKTRKNYGGKIVLNGIGLMARLPDGIDEETVAITIVKKVTKEDGNVEVTNIDTLNYRVDMKATFYGREADKEIYEIEPIELITDGSEYEISYIYDPELFIPYNNKIVCNCEGVKTKLKKFYSVVPVGNAYGLIFDAFYKCDDQFITCALAYSSGVVKTLISEAIRTATMYKFLVKEQAKASTGATASNVLKVREFEPLIKAFGEAYVTFVNDIISSYNTYANKLDCFTCNTSQNIGRNEGIFVT